jgi:hypothetical protein
MNEPIGCRDRSTSKYLTDRGVDAYFSGCLTLTLDNINKKNKENATYNVDIVSPNNGKYITHQKHMYGLMDYTQRIPIAQKLLDGYAKAKLVTTNRVHVMLPCLAFGTEVNFIVKKNNDPRLVGILELIHDKELLKSTIKGIEEDFKKRFMEKIVKYYTCL